MPVMTGDIGLLISKAGHSVDIERAIASEDEYGSRTRVWGSASEGVSCWVQPAASSVREDYAARNLTVTHTIYFATDPGAVMGDRVKFGTRYMKIQGARNTAETSELWVLDCEEVKAT